MYEVRDDIEKPAGRIRKKPVYPTDDLKVDQSFVFPLEKIAGVRSSVRYWCRKGGKKFLVFKRSESEGACLRTG